MSLNTALTTAQYAQLQSGHHAGDLLIKLFSNQVLLHGTITTDLTTPGVSWAQFAYTLISGTYTNVIKDMVLVVSATNDLTAGAQTYYARVRLAPSSTIIYANESSANFSPGAYFWVLNTFYPQYKLSRPSTNDPATAIELWDYNEAFSLPLPAIVGLPTVVGGYAWIGGKFRYAFDISQSFAVASGATVSSYGYSFSSGSVVAGATNTAIVVMDFDAGEQWALVHATDSNGNTLYRHVGIQVLDDSTNPPDTGFGDIKISSRIDEGYTMTTTAFDGVDSLLNNTLAVAIRVNEQYGSTTRSLWGGSSATVTNKVLSSNTVQLTAANTFEVGQQVVVAISDSVFDGTFTILSCNSAQFTYHKVHANVGSTGASGLAVVNSRNVDFVGWFQRETDNVQSDANYSALSTASFTFIGVGSRMSKIVSELLPITSNSSPTLCGQIKDLTPWRTYLHYLTRYTTVGNLCDLLVDDTTTAFAFPAIPTVSGSVLSNLATIGKQTNTFIVFSPEGTISFNRSAEFLSQFQRNSLVNVANWDQQDALTITREYEPDPSTGRIDGDSAFYNPSNGQVTVYTSRSPGIAQGEAPGNSTLSTQILLSTSVASAALDDIEARVGTQLLIDNNNEVLRISHPSSYVGLPFICSRSQLFTWTLDTTLGGPHGVNRIIYTTAVSWWVEDVQEGYSPEKGEFTVEVTYRRLVPVADPGDNTTQVAPGQTPITLPDFGLPAFNFDFPELTVPDAGTTVALLPPAALLPPKGKIATFTGQELVVKSHNQVFWLTNFINLTTPHSNDITPPSGTTTTVSASTPNDWFNTWAIGFGTFAAGSGPGGTDAIQSVYMRTDAVPVYGTLITWVFPFPVTLTGWTYQFEQNSSTDDLFGYVLLYDAADVIIGGTHQVTAPAASLGWFLNQDLAASIAGVKTAIFRVDQGDASGTPINYMAQAKLFYEYDTGTTWSNVDAVVSDLTSPATAVGVYALVDDTTNSFMFYTTNGAVAVPAWVSGAQLSGLYRVARLANGAGGVFAYAPAIGGSSKVVYSSTYGNTWGSPLTVGTTPGSVGGFDAQRAGTVSYAGCAAKVRKATTLGGAYSDFIACTGANPVCVIIPYYRRNSTTKNTAVSDPDFLVALDTADSDGSTLYWVNGTTAVKTAIIPVAGMTFSHADCVTVRYGNEIAVWGTVGGQQKCYTSVDGGATWTFRSNVTNAGKIRCRRNDSRPSPNGQIYLAQADVIDYSSKWFSNALYPRNMPVTGITSFDTVI